MNLSAPIAASLRKTLLFQKASDDLCARLAEQARPLSLDKGALLFSFHDPADRFFLVMDGWIKLFRETIDGSQAVVDIVTNGHVFGETSLFEDNLYPFSAETAEKSTVVSFPLAVLRHEIESNPAIALTMLSVMARYRREQDLEIEHRTLQNAPQRIGCFLLRLIDPRQQGQITVHLPYDKTLVASRLGMQPETFSRALNKLKEATDISIKGATIEIANYEQLVKFSCIACSNEFPCGDRPKTACGGCG